MNNPLNYTDPSGHMVACDRDDWACQHHWDEPITYDDEEYTIPLTEEQAEVVEFLIGGSELVASVAFEPIDWALTIDYCIQGDCSLWMLAGFLPFIPSSAGKHGDDVVDLYRAVSKSELDDIFNNRIFRPKPGGGSFDVKEFWLTMNGARGHAERYNLPEIVKVTVPKRVLEYANQTWSNLDQLGPAAGWVDEGLDAFNDAIISITHVWSK